MRIFPLVLLMLCTSVVLAHEDEADYEQARRLLDSGKILSLDEIVERVGIPPGGRLLDVELENEHGRWEYELEYLVGGQVREYRIDAATGAVLGEEEEHD